MDYNELEESVALSQPVECYRFIGSTREYLYTSANQTISLEGRRYWPIAQTRSNIKSMTQDQGNVTLDLEIPCDVEVVQDYAYAETPPKLELELYRRQMRATSDSFVLFWKGEVTGFNIRGRMASIKVPSLASLALQSNLPNVFYQAPCNHILYDERCTVSRASNSVSRIVGGASGTNIYLTASAGPDDDFSAGEIVNNRTQERRLVVSNNDTHVVIGFPFVDIRPADNVTLYRGCDHTISHCKDKFSNAINFGGFPYVPVDNPFEGSL